MIIIEHKEARQENNLIQVGMSTKARHLHEQFSRQERLFYYGIAFYYARNNITD